MGVQYMSCFSREFLILWMNSNSAVLDCIGLSGLTELSAEAHESVFYRFHGYRFRLQWIFTLGKELPSAAVQDGATGVYSTAVPLWRSSWMISNSLVYNPANNGEKEGDWDWLVSSNWALNIRMRGLFTCKMIVDGGKKNAKISHQILL